MSAKGQKPVKGLSDVDRKNIDAFLSQEQPKNKKGKVVWDKVPLKKLTNFKLCKDTDGAPVLMYNDGKQRFGVTIKDWNQFAMIKGDMLMNFVNKVDYLDSLAKYVFNSDASNTSRINSI